MGFSKILVFLGMILLFFGGYLVFERYDPRRLEFRNFESQTEFSAQVYPVRIIIPSLNIDLNIFPAKITKGRWEATTKGVSYLASSPIPGSLGNSILYGHNFSNLLGSLVKAKPGEEIEIFFNDKTKKTFMIKYAQVVSPSQTSVLAQTQDRRMTLYTCTGFLDSQRFVVTAFLVDIASAK